MSLSRRIAATLIMVAYVLTGGTTRSWILCFGSDGHVTVELTGSTCCQGSGQNNAPSDPASAGTFLASIQGPGACGGCMDIPLFAAETAGVDVFKLQAKDAMAVALSFLCAPSFLLVGPIVVSTSKRDDHALHRDRTLSHLRTVVLRC